MCSASGLNAAFAFSIISQIVFLTIFLFLLLRHFEINVVSSRILSAILTVSVVAFLLLGIIVLAATGDCFDFLKGDPSRKVAHNLEWGVLDILLTLLVGALVAVNVFVKKEPLFGRGEKSADNPLPYVQPTQQPPPQQPPVEAQYNPQPQ